MCQTIAGLPSFRERPVSAPRDWVRWGRWRQKTYASFVQRRLPDTFCKVQRSKPAPALTVRAIVAPVLRNCFGGTSPFAKVSRSKDQVVWTCRKSILIGADTSTVTRCCNGSFRQKNLSFPSCTMRSESMGFGGPRLQPAWPFRLNPLYLKLAFRHKFLSEIRSAALCPSAHSNRTAATVRRHTAF